MQNEKSYARSKLGVLLDERGLTLKEFAALIFEKTGYLIAVTNLSNYITGYKPIKKVETAMFFAQALEVPLTDIL